MRLTLAGLIFCFSLIAQTGDYSISGVVVNAQKPGFSMFFSPNDLKSRQFDRTASVSGVELKLSPLGVIEGKVVDQNDEPLRGVNFREPRKTKRAALFQFTAKWPDG